MKNENNYDIPDNWLKRFVAIWTGQAFSILGSQLVSFALVWWLTKETGSAVVLAASSAMIYLPRFFLGPFVGALIDRWNRRWVIVLSDAAIALATLVLALLFWLDVVQLWHIYLLVFLRSVGGAFHSSAMEASMVLIVPEKHLTRVAGINQILNGVVNILGPALGAFLMELLPMQGVLSVDVITAMIAIFPLLLIKLPQPKDIKPFERITPRLVVQDVVEGFRYMVHWRGLMIIFCYALLLNFLFAPTESFLPLLITDHFNGGVWHLGLMESLAGAGMIAGGVMLGIWGGFKNKILTILAGIGVMGGSAIIIGIAPENGFPLAVIAFFIFGLSNTVMDGVSMAIMQILVLPKMQGRVFSMIRSANGIASPIGLMVAAPIVERLGVQFWFLLSGGISVILAGVSLFISDLMMIEAQGYPQTQASTENQEYYLPDVEE